MSGGRRNPREAHFLKRHEPVKPGFENRQPRLGDFLFDVFRDAILAAWPDGADHRFVAYALGTALRDRDASLATLHPSTDAQKDALAAAKATVNSIGQSRLQMSFALPSPISIPLIVIVVAWATFLFFGYGLMAGGSATSRFSQNPPLFTQKLLFQMC